MVVQLPVLARFVAKSAKQSGMSEGRQGLSWNAS